MRLFVRRAEFYIQSKARYATYPTTVLVSGLNLYRPAIPSAFELFPWSETLCAVSYSLAQADWSYRRPTTEA
jgi:hypothetical protein